MNYQEFSKKTVKHDHHAHPITIKSICLKSMSLLQKATRVLAFLFNVAIVIAASIELKEMFMEIYALNITAAIQSGLFVLILLEMFYVVRSFIKYGSVNISLIICVGIVAIVKEMIFNIKNPDLNTGIALSVMFLALAFGLLIENRHYAMKVSQGRKKEKVNHTTWEEFLEERAQEQWKKEHQTLSP